MILYQTVLHETLIISLMLSIAQILNNSIDKKLVLKYNVFIFNFNREILQYLKQFIKTVKSVTNMLSISVPLE